MIDFGFSEVAASDLLLATDVAELVASSSVAVGVRAGGRAGAGDRGPTTARRRPRPAPAVGSQRRDPHGA